MKGNTLLDSGILVSAQSLVHIILTHSNSEGHSALLYILSLFQTSTASPNLSPSGADDGDLPFAPLRPGAHLCQKQLVPLLSAVIGAMHKTTDENQAPPQLHPFFLIVSYFVWSYPILSLSRLIPLSYANSFRGDPHPQLVRTLSDFIPSPSCLCLSTSQPSSPLPPL